MSCQTWVQTKSGNFSFYDEKVTLCQAEKKCLAKGEILAPITNRRDKTKIQDLFDSNVGIQGCNIVTNSFANYWIGLQLAFTENGQQKTFTNGVKWKERKHSKIYTDYNKDDYTACPIALYEPATSSYSLVEESGKCDWTMKNYYVCFKPINNAVTGSLVQRQEDFDDDAFILPSNVVIAFVFAIGAFVGACIQNRKQAKERAELNEYRLASSLEKKNDSKSFIEIHGNQ